MNTRYSRRGLAGFLVAAILAANGCSDDDAAPPPPPSETRLETTRLCALVPARDPAAAAFPPTPPVKAFGTDLGWTYERDGVITMLFGDTWQRIDICPIQANDDCLATMTVPPNDWPGYTAQESIPDAQCPELTFALDEAGTSFGPLELRRWDGVLVPLGPLNTPLFGFFDGEREWAAFIVGGGQACSRDAATSGGPCPDELSPQAADLVCGLVAGDPLCIDPTSIKSGNGQQALYLHMAERVGPTQFISRAMFLTNKYLNLTARPVRAFDPDDASGRDYRLGTNALVMWGRPGFDDQAREGEAPPYFMYHPLPFQFTPSGDQIDFRPQYLREVADEGDLVFSTDQADAEPLYTGEFEPVNHAAVSYIEPLSRWAMFYGGNTVDFVNVDGTAGHSQPVVGALFARFATDPWGPWTEPQLVLTEEQVAEDMVCGKRAPVGCLPPPNPLIRPQCLEFVDPLGGGAIYGANIIDQMTRPAATSSGTGRGADVFWNISTWHPYTVVLVKTHIEVSD